MTSDLCQKRDCERRATVALRVCVPAKGAPDESCAASALINVRVCDEHLAEDEARNWVRGDAGAHLRPLLMMAAKGATLDFDRVWTEGVPVGLPEVSALAPRKPN